MQFFLRLMKKDFQPLTLSLFVGLFVTATCNYAFFAKVLGSYEFTISTAPALISIFFLLLCAQILFLSFFSFRPIIKPALAIFLLLASMIKYFADSYGLIIDQSMLMNILKTDKAEARDLLSFGILKSILLFGVFPAIVVARLKLAKTTLLKDLGRAGISVLFCTFLALISVFSFSKFYASFFREHKSIRSYANPLYSIYSVAKLGSDRIFDGAQNLAALGRDSTISPDDRHRELVILVVGETARADRFSLNGYSRETNPRLKKEDVVSFRDVWSCGTSTATSVPCMFSGFGRSAFSDKKGRNTENLLDILKNTKRISVLWRDNNSDSKGVANRVTSQDYKSPSINTVCDVECRDVGMLSGLQEYIDQQKGDILIVLHQMGNHGPAYYKRYPKEFEVFKPTCQSNELEKCSVEEINNAYDNAILYTDYFLYQTIALLKQNSEKYEAGLIYLSDHGESLGEKGIFLHGLPYLVAPDEQKKVPMIIWLNEHLKADHSYEQLKRKSALTYSHDNLFHSLLGLFEVESSIYRKELDIFFDLKQKTLP